MSRESEQFRPHLEGIGFGAQRLRTADGTFRGWRSFCVAGGKRCAAGTEMLRILMRILSPHALCDLAAANRLCCHTQDPVKHQHRQHDLRNHQSPLPALLDAIGMFLNIGISRPYSGNNQDSFTANCFHRTGAGRGSASFGPTWSGPGSIRYG